MRAKQKHPDENSKPHTHPARFGRVVGFALSVFSSAAVAVSGQEATPLEYRYLWDPQTPEDWQIIERNPKDMCWGEDGQIFIADTGSARILLVDTDGLLIQEIGRLGSGPGEFRAPSDLAYDSANHMLWVGDWPASRYVRFQLDEGKYTYHSSFFSSRVSDGATANLAIDDLQHYWVAGQLFIRDGVSTEGSFRIGMFDTAGSVVRQIAPAQASESVLPASLWNVGDLIPLGTDRLAFVWEHRPVIEVWGRDGQLVVERGLTGPGVERDPPVRDSLGRYRVETIFLATCYEKQTDMIFVVLGSQEWAGWMFIGLDAGTLSEKERFVLPLQKDPETNPWIGHLLAERTQGLIRFYLLDHRTLSLIVLRPVESPNTPLNLTPAIGVRTTPEAVASRCRLAARR